MTALERAQAALAAGRLDDAQQAIAPLVASGGRDEVLVAAEIASRRGDFHAAVGLLRPLAQRLPGDATVRRALAFALDGAGDAEAAIQAYADVLRVRPDDATAARRFAELLLAKGEAALASAVVAAALRTHPRDAALHTVHARALLARGRLPQALQAAQQATALAPSAPGGWFELGRVELARGEPGAAIAALERVLSLDSQHVRALVTLGGVHLDAGRAAQAVMLLRRAATIAADDVAILNLYATALDANGDGDAAAEVLQRAIALAPRVALLRRNAAEVLLGAGRCQESFDEAARALDLARAGGNATERAAAEETLARAIVARALAQAACRGGSDIKMLRDTIDQDLRSAGLPLSEAIVDRIAQDVRAAVRTALKRCHAAASGVVTPPSPQGTP